MGRIIFGNDGKPAGVDGTKNSNIEDYGVDKIKNSDENEVELRDSSSLEFLKEKKVAGDVPSKDYWSLY
ncbi:hypothetical protein LCGC14_3075470, partial [marine sediment metagenome]